MNRLLDLAVTGLPEPQEAHAIIMAKFARDCMQKMHQVTSALEVRLGPDTCDLSMRFGLNRCVRCRLQYIASFPFLMVCSNQCTVAKLPVAS